MFYGYNVTTFCSSLLDRFPFSWLLIFLFLSLTPLCLLACFPACTNLYFMCPNMRWFQLAFTMLDIINMPYLANILLCTWCCSNRLGKLQILYNKSYKYVVWIRRVYFILLSLFRIKHAVFFSIKSLFFIVFLSFWVLSTAETKEHKKKIQWQFRT